MLIPTEFELLGQKYIVKLLTREAWVKYPHLDKTWGYFDPDSSTIWVMQRDSSGEEWTYLHELVHAILYAMGNDLNEDEKFVDLFSGMLHQYIKSARFKR